MTRETLEHLVARYLGDGDEEAAAQLEMQERAVAGVRTLPEPYRLTVVLRFHYGRTLAEILPVKSMAPS